MENEEHAERWFLLDDVNLGNTAVTILNKDKLILAQGGLITDITFESADVMSLDEFKASMGDQDIKEGTITLYRDSLRGNMSLLVPDQVIRFNGAKFTDIKEADVVKAMGTQDLDIPLGTPWPIVHIKRSERTGYKIMFSIPESSRVIRWDVIDPFIVHFPPMIYSVELDPSGSYVKNDYLLMNPTGTVNPKVAYELPLPNIYPHTGKLCHGSAESENMNLSSYSALGNLILSSYERFMGAHMNHDLVDPGYCFELLSGIDLSSLVDTSQISIRRLISMYRAGDAQAGIFALLTVKEDGWRKLDVKKLHEVSVSVQD